MTKTTTTKIDKINLKTTIIRTKSATKTKTTIITTTPTTTKEQ